MASVAPTTPASPRRHAADPEDPMTDLLRGYLSTALFDAEYTAEPTTAETP